MRDAKKIAKAMETFKDPEEEELNPESDKNNDETKGNNGT